jgi:hypothetical protein
VDFPATFLTTRPMSFTTFEQATPSIPSRSKIAGASAVVEPRLPATVLRASLFDAISPSLQRKRQVPCRTVLAQGPSVLSPRASTRWASLPRQRRKCLACYLNDWPEWMAEVKIVKSLMMPTLCRFPARHSRQKVQARSAVPYAVKRLPRVPGGRHMECAYYFHFCRL